jgi:hypothetical protein
MSLLITFTESQMTCVVSQNLVKLWKMEIEEIRKTDTSVLGMVEENNN